MTDTPEVEKRLTPILQRLLDDMKAGVMPPGFDPSNEEEFERLTPPPITEESYAEDQQTEEDERNSGA